MPGGSRRRAGKGHEAGAGRIPVCGDADDELPYGIRDARRGGGAVGKSDGPREAGEALEKSLPVHMNQKVRKAWMVRWEAG